MGLNIFNCLRKKLLQAPADFVLLVVLVEIPANLCRRIFVVGRRGAGVILFFSEMILVSSFFYQNCGWRRSVRSRMQLPGLWILLHSSVRQSSGNTTPWHAPHETCVLYKYL